MKHRIFITAAAVIFIAGVIFSLFFLYSSPKKRIKISRDGEVLYTLDLTKEKNRSFVIPYGESSNTIEIRDGKIRVSEAECPDKVCVNTGWLNSQAIPIVCLPNHLIIEFDGSDNDIDAAAE